MKTIRITWKDTATVRNYVPLNYRGYTIYGAPEGWTTDVPGDKRIYSTRADAQNGVDNLLGGFGKKGVSRTRRRVPGDIRIVGEKNETA
jgi:hypothetical protein